MENLGINCKTSGILASMQCLSLAPIANSWTFISIQLSTLSNLTKRHEVVKDTIQGLSASGHQTWIDKVYQMNRHWAHVSTGLAASRALLCHRSSRPVPVSAIKSAPPCFDSDYWHTPLHAAASSFPTTLQPSPLPTTNVLRSLNAFLTRLILLPGCLHHSSDPLLTR